MAVFCIKDTILAVVNYLLHLIFSSQTPGVQKGDVSSSISSSNTIFRVVMAEEKVKVKIKMLSKKKYAQ